MKQQLSTFSSIVILGLLLCFGLYYRYPHAIRSFLSRFIPGVEVNYERADIRYADTSNEDLKSILGEVLLEERKAGRIFVKYEINERCFHITSRAR